MKFLLDTKNNFPLNNKLGKLKSVYTDCVEWGTYKNGTDEIEKQLNVVLKELGNKISSVDELVKNIEGCNFDISYNDTWTNLKGTVDKVMFDVDGIWVDCFFDDGNEYFGSFLFAWTNECVIAYKF